MYPSDTKGTNGRNGHSMAWGNKIDQSKEEWEEGSRGTERSLGSGNVTTFVTATPLIGSSLVKAVKDLPGM